MNPNLHIRKLHKAPLKEVIFQVRWELGIDEDTNKQFDPGFEIALGNFAKIIQEKFNDRKRILNPLIPKELLNYVPQFQFSNPKKKFPLVQLGEGILTINDTDENYIWKDNFLPLIEFSLDTLFESYSDEINIIFSSLRYIDAIDFEPVGNNNELDFISKNLNYKVTKNFPIPGKLSDFSFKETYNTEDGFNLSLNISTGLDSGTKKKKLVWQNTVSKESHFNKASLIVLAEKAHKIASKLFRNMLNPEFYESFK